MSEFPDGGRAAMVSHAEQLRAEVLEFMVANGNDWAHQIHGCLRRLSNTTGDIGPRTIGKLAEIGFIQVLLEAPESASEDTRNNT